MADQNPTTNPAPQDADEVLSNTTLGKSLFGLGTALCFSLSQLNVPIVILLSPLLVGRKK